MKALKTMVAMALMMVATMASAEQKGVVRPAANVPFSFKVGGKALPAGAYQVRVDGAALMLIGPSGEKVIALSHGVQSRNPSEKTKLEFVNNGGTYELYRVWQVGQNAGRELSLAKAEQKVGEGKSRRTVIAVGL